MEPHAASFKEVLFGAAILIIPVQGHADPGSRGPFLGLSGYWSGAGTVTMTNGATERIRCKANYTVNASGKAVQQTLRCASDSYKFEISSNVTSESGSLSGSWAEATRGVSGNISGRASGAEIMANVAGAGFTAHLDVRTQGDKQSVTNRPQAGNDVAGVSIALRK
ncbi:MAG TPA: hypothetical protein VIF02_03155 [Methylocella sp.]